MIKSGQKRKTSVILSLSKYLIVLKALIGFDKLNLTTGMIKVFVSQPSLMNVMPENQTAEANWRDLFKKTTLCFLKR